MRQLSDFTISGRTPDLRLRLVADDGAAVEFAITPRKLAELSEAVGQIAPHAHRDHDQQTYQKPLG